MKVESNIQYLTAAPNPAGDYIRISLNEIGTGTQNCTIIITNANGKVVKTQTLAKGQGAFVWHTNYQVAGVYFARLLADGNHRGEVKILIQK